MMNEGKKSLGSHLWSWSGTPWVQHSHRWSTEETLQPQAPSEHQQSPSSSGLVSLWFLFSTCTLIYTSWGFTTTAWRCGHVAHSVGCGRRQRCHPLGMRVVAVVIFFVEDGAEEEGVSVLALFWHSRDHLAVLQRAWTSTVIETMTHPCDD